MLEENCKCSTTSEIKFNIYSHYSIEIDGKRKELSIWDGDECLEVFGINYCPNCGKKL